MRFITKEIYYSMQFYSYFLVGIDETDLLIYNPEVQKEYRFYMERDFNQYIFNYNEVKEILFDESQKLNDLDKNIYCKMLPIAQDSRGYERKQFFMLKEAIQDVQNSGCSENIKILAKCNYHDCKIINIEFTSEWLFIEFDDFSWDRSTRYIFKVQEFISDIPIEELKKFNVLYEEVINNFKEAIFEYNILLRKWGEDEQANQIEEISIIFTEVKNIIHTNY